ncbi:MAG: SirB2 family protein [Sterolibacterium sp.]|jgi:uncharacterized membrane protein SirB2|nr:SirB2 family protein [Sterolibacterium sp.]
MNSYLAVKHLHVLCVTLSGAGFLLRGFWMLADSPMLQRRIVRILPHINDTLLLAAAIALVVMSGQYPFVVPWVTAKVLGLLVYIVLGAIALKRGRTKRVRAMAWLLSLGVFAYIVSVALTRNPLGFLAGLNGG